ncbi:MAG: hypothetical protein WBD45_11765 [Terriglobales bacterium]
MIKIGIAFALGCLLTFAVVKLPRRDHPQPQQLQQILSETALANAISTPVATQIQLNLSTPACLYADREAMLVMAELVDLRQRIVTTDVLRGYSGTAASLHPAGTIIFKGPCDIGAGRR